MSHETGPIPSTTPPGGEVGRLRALLEWVEVERCPLCGSRSSEHEHFESWIQEFDLDYSICSHCGLVFQSPRLSRSSLEAYYRTLYHRHRAPDPAAVERNRWVQERRAEHLVGLLRARAVEPSRVLDVGSSRGALLGAIRAEWGSEVHGVEPGEDHRARANEAGIHTVAALDDLEPELLGGFDLVSLSHVLEHMSDPGTSLADIRRDWLSPGGRVVVEVPNLFWHPALELAHMSAFSPAALQATLGMAGFEVQDLLTHGKPYSRLLPLFVLAIAAPAEEAAGERTGVWVPGVKLRRRMGRWCTRAARAMSAHLLSREALAPWDRRP